MHSTLQPTTAMNKKSYFLLFLTVIACSCANKKTSTSYRMPAEWEPQDSLWMGFRTAERNISSDSITATDSLTLKLIKEITVFIPMKLIVENDSFVHGSKKIFFDHGIDTTRIDLFIQSPTDFWYRDPGPVFALSDKNELAIADFKYTNYRNAPQDSISEKAKAQEKIDKNVASRLGIPTIELKVALEGGSFETNGKGVVIQNEELTLGRNPRLGKKEIEEDYKKIGISKVIWVKQGLADDAQGEKIGDYYVWGAGGHTDEFVRFADDSTILLAWVNDAEKDLNEINKRNRERMQRDLDVLQSATDANGKKFRIIKIPLPPLQFQKTIVDSSTLKWYNKHGLVIKFNDFINEVSCSSYLNFITTNGLVIIPCYWKPGMPLSFKEADEGAKKIFQQLYQDRKIMQANPLILNYHAGGMHCIYQPQPRLKKS